jgi:DNA-binding beta-propeller fold protein YncE
VNHPQIAVFARSAKEDTPYLRSIEGQKSLLGRTMHDLAFDAIHDEIVVTSALAQAILTFRGAANGEEAPIRFIQGDKTHIKGLGADSAVGKVSADPVHNELYLANGDQTILVFDRLANGNVAPKRVLGGPATKLKLGGASGTCVRVDPIHNLLLVPSGGVAGGNVLVFDRTASGNTPPKAIIQGPVVMGNQFEVYAPKKRLIAYAKGGNLEIWNIPETGVSTDPPLRIPTPLGRGGNNETGIVLDPLHKEVIIATAAGNSIMTFSVPEVFDDWPAARSVSSSTVAH